MKRFLIVIVFSGIGWSQNGGVVPPPDIAGAGGQIANAANKAQIQVAQAALIRQQTALLRQQAELLKQQYSEKAAALAAEINNSWHIKDSGPEQVMIECSVGRHAEVFTKLNLANVVCVPDAVPGGKQQ